MSCWNVAVAVIQRKSDSMEWLVAVLVLAVVFASGCLKEPPTTKPMDICKGVARCYNGTITGIVDGDTLYVNNDSIRLALVDAPDVYTEAGKESKDFVSSICPVGSTATVDEDDGQTSGSYGRIVAVVYCSNKNLNAELISKGYATVYVELCDISEFTFEDWVKNEC